MLHRLAIFVLAIASSWSALDDASANGRPPNTATINFKQGDDQTIAAGMTFGLVISKDGGQTWHWVCEDAVGYGGMYDPDYAFASDGTLFGTTFEGLVANRDGCSFASTSVGTDFMSTITLGPTGRLHVAAADDNNGKIYRSDDGGLTFPVSAMPGQLKDWWETIEVAPSDPDRVYLVGYRLMAPNPKVHLLFKSINGGTSFTSLPVTDFAVMPNSSLEIVGISPTNADIVFAKVALEDNSIADGIYRSTNGGQSWTKIIGGGTPRLHRGAISFLVRRNGHLVAATEQVDAANGLGAFVSTNNGDTWTPLVSPPHIRCLEENSAGEVWACTNNYGMPGVPSDGYGIMKTSGDLSTWTGVLKFQELAGPLACPAGTVQNDQCDAKLWCGLCMQLGCDPKRDCPTNTVDGAPPDAGDVPPITPPKDTCCGAGHGPTSLVVGAVVGLLLGRRRRLRARNATDSGRV